MIPLTLVLRRSKADISGEGMILKPTTCCPWMNLNCLENPMSNFTVSFRQYTHLALCDGVKKGKNSELRWNRAS